MADETADTERRKAWMSLLAKAPEAELLELWAAYDDAPGFDWLRAPEAGGVMVRGRLGGTGAPFNLGEMTVTRCSLSLADGTVGHAYVQGRSKAKAEAAALIDALMQTGAAADVQGRILAPLGNLVADRASRRAAKAAATKVDFFTMVRGDNA
ncbi:phosphonate C-P lyase system protein PhnG [Marinibacterium profundimaris]|uniref:Phosphonate metabolism protein PhnG n=1 Tax=Marinibacterium profundimaris TaxID=1679460 RepID=A0A225ND53_9RHOB|nr:phosphonate C-P lyase system protein PhnG [Marinibacterium profundimaris]OWU69517.1 phosphonate metabolism protein PhnG [Marinibacterium profundimaris]